MPRFAANLTMMFNEWPFLDRFAAAADAGFEAVEFLFPYEHSPDEVAQRLASHNLRLALFNLPPGDWSAGERGLAALSGREEEIKAGTRRALDYIEVTGATQVHLMAGIADRNSAAAQANYRRAVSSVAEQLHRAGVTLLIEPINRRDMPGYFLDDFGYAEQLIRQLGLPNLKLQFDVYHRQIMHGDVTVALRTLMPIIGHIQVASVPSRHEPDREELSYQHVFKTLDSLDMPATSDANTDQATGRSQGLGGSRTRVQKVMGASVNLALGCIGDDYTGSADLANALTRAGLRTVQTIGVPDESLQLPDVDAVVIALKSRSVPAEEAVRMTLPARAWLRSRGARHLMFKICSTFDSTDRGNIGPVLDALRQAEGAPMALVNCAFPETGRTIYRGNLFVGNVPLNESPLRDHPLNPMHDSNLVRVLGRQSRNPVGMIPLEDVEAGVEAIRSRMTSLVKSGCGAAIIDCVLDRQLRQIGEAAIATPLSVGASGLGIGLARALVDQGAVTGKAMTSTAQPLAAPVVMLSGSCSAATLKQVEAAEGWAQVLRLDPYKLLEDETEIQRVIDWTQARLGGAPILVASSAPPEAVQRLQARYGADRPGRLIEDALASIAAAVVAAGVRRLIVAGGETSGAVVNRLGHRAFAIGAEIAPGVPVLRTIGTDGPEMVLALKSGNFGAGSFFADAIALMQ